MPKFIDDPVVSEDDGTAIWGNSRRWMGVYGKSDSTTGGHGVMGEAIGTGVVGVGHTWLGVYGETHAPANAGAAGVWGDGKGGGDGVKGVAQAPGKAAVCGFQLGNNGPGIFGQGSPAGHFAGDVVVTGDLVLAGADVAEQFDVTKRTDGGADVGPGSVVVLDEEGAVAPCTRAYDSRVAGVVSGAGDRKPALVLDRGEQQPDAEAGRRALAVVGKVWCQSDATAHPIRVGDLLTTSSTPGHAMAAVDRDASFGAVLGKALSPLRSGTGLVLVLVGLG